ncbi:MAG: hypothetical protein KBS41_02535 [Oscillospiraceae bacterium]|nr:hypothetical protein [Candidatus Equicaccousia limihippi]
MTKKSFSVKDLFYNKRFLMVFSFIAAVVIWFVISFSQAPDTEKTINDVPVNFPIENSAVEQLGLDVVSDTNSYKVAVTLRGPSYVVSTVTADDISLSPSLSSVNAPGTYNLDLKATKIKGGDYEIESLSPSVITVKFDYIDTKEYKLETVAKGAAATAGLVAEDAVVTDSNYSSVTVKGPRTEMEKIDKVVAFAQVDKTLSKTTSFAAQIKIYDANGKELDTSVYKITGADGEEITDLQISVPISKVKEVPISVKFKNEPAGFANSPLKRTVSINRISIIGPAETIDSISSIALREIDFNEITPAHNTFEVEPVLPDGVKAVDSIKTVKVTFSDVKNYSQKTFTVSSFKAEGTKATLKTPIKNVVLAVSKALRGLFRQTTFMHTPTLPTKRRATTQ